MEDQATVSDSTFRDGVDASCGQREQVSVQIPTIVTDFRGMMNAAIGF